MTRENRNLIINAIIALLVSITFILGYDYYNNKNNGTELDDKEQFKLSHIVSEERTNDGGYIFELNTNDVTYVGDSSGKVIIKLTLDQDFVIKEYEFLEYEHTEGFRSSVETLLDSYVTNGTKLSQIRETDANTTGSTNTLTALLKMFVGLANYLDVEEEAPGLSFADKHLVSEEVTSTGYIFELDTTDVTYVGDSQGKVIIKLTLDKDLVIKEYEFLEYEHTGGFRGNVETLLDAYVADGKKLSEIELEEANTTGSTNTLTALLRMFIDLNNYIENDMVIQEPELSFEEKHLILEEVTATNYIFELDTTPVVYVGANTGKVVIKLTLDKDLVITDYEFLEYEHTAGFRDNVETLLDAYVANGKKLSEIEIEEANTTGSTNTLTALLQMFIDLNDYIENDMEIQEPELSFEEKHIISEEKIVTGYIFELDTTPVVYVGANTGKVVIKLTLDNDLVITDYEFLVYEHTGGFRGNVEALLDDYVANGKKLSEIEIEEANSTGSTNTLKALLKLFIDLNDYIEEGE